MRRLSEVGIHPRTQLGQNFLIDLNLLDVLVRAAEIGPDDVVLEVGTGTGSLTALMAQQAAAVVTVEIDREMFRLAGEELEAFANVRMLMVDALKGKNHLNPEVLEAVGEQLAAGPGRHFKLAANLPYHIATPLVSNLLTLDRPPATMTVTIQKEVADRITAEPRSKDYGSLSIWVQSQCRVETVRILPPTVFWPRPKVHSAIIQITLDEQLRGRIPDRRFFHEFVRAMFMHRRKFLRSELLSAFKDRLDKPQVDAILARMALGADARAEQLSVEQMLALCEIVREQLATN
ncbi:MAG: 16S rRNA (adenine(1518)-N(6)/adenine(1519)-N(6))-dimethyltransferase RsmA [Thermoguttaceae bacterium]